MLILRLIIALLLMSLPASAHFGLGGKGGPGSVVQTIASVPLSNNSFTAGSSSGTVVGIVGTPVMSPSSPAFSGSCCTLSGADAASFQIVGSSLETNGTPCSVGPCTFHINLVATQAGISNSPFSQAETITGNAASQTIASVPLSGTTFPPGASSGTVVGTIGTPVMSPASPAFSGSCCTLSGTDAASFTVVGASLETVGTLCGSPPCTYHINLVATQGGISNSPFSQAQTITSSSLVFSQTVKNIGASTTPTIAGTTMVATHFGTMYPPGAVPSGDIVVASVGGTPLANAQIDSQQCSYWYTGSTPTSLRFCPFSGFVPQMTAGSRQQVTFSIQAGSFPTSSSITPATIAAASDFKTVLSNANGSYTEQGIQGPSVWYGAYPGFYITGGSVTGGYVRNQPTAAAPPQGLLGNNCTSGGANCITPSNYQASVSTTTASGSPVLTFSPSIPVSAQYIFSSKRAITILDVTNPSSIPDNTTISSLNFSTNTVTMSANAAANITSSDILTFSYTIHGGTSDAAYTVNTNGSGIITGVNIIKAGSGFSASGSGAMTADIDTILNAYGTTQPPACASMPGAAAFTESFSGSTMTVSGVTGIISIGQMVDDGTNLAIITAGSGTTWTIQGTLAAGPIAAQATPALCIYTSGPTMYGLHVQGAYRDNVTGAKDAWQRFRGTIEAWTGPTGLYAIKPTIITDNSIYKNLSGFPNIVYDADFLNGSTEIVGCAQGGSNNKWCAIQQQVNGSWTTLDPCESCVTGASGRPVWLPPTGGYSTANSQALAQVVVAPASADLAFIHASHAALPLNNTIVPPTKVTTTSGTTFGSPFYVNLYAPYSFGGTDGTVGFGSGGSQHFNLGPMGGLWGTWYLSTVNSASDNGVSFLQNMRVAADVMGGITDGPRQDATGLPINYYESGSGYTPPAAFTDPAVWDFVMDQYYQSSLYPHGMWQGDIPSPAVQQPALANTQIENNDTYADTSHYPEINRGIYLIEAERYMLETWLDEVDGLSLGPSNARGGSRSFSFGGTRYDAQGMSSDIQRQNAWWMNAVGPLAYLGPPNEPAIQYYRHVVADNFAMKNAFQSFTGTSNFWSPFNGGSTFPFTKTFDNTTLGMNEAPFSYVTSPPRGETISVQPFMFYYSAMNNLDMEMLDNGNDSNLLAYTHSVIDNAAVKNPAVNTCTYNDTSYAWQWGVDVPTYMPQAGWDATTIAGTPQRGSGPVSSATTMHVEAGSSIVSASLQLPAQGNTNWVFAPLTTGAVSPGGMSIPLASVTSPSRGVVNAGMVIKDVTNPTALTWPTYITGAPTGLNIPISSPVTGPGISSGDQISISASWPWIYPVYVNTGSTRLASGTRMVISNVNWNGDASPNNQMDYNGAIGPAVAWPPASSPQVIDGQWMWLCMDASGAAFGQLSTTQPTISGGVCTGGTTYVTWTHTGNFSTATVANASCPAASFGDWRNAGPMGEEMAEVYPTATWRKALNGVLGTSADAPTAITQLTPYVTPLSTTYPGAQSQWGGDDHF